ncbi:coiled-coil domain-containing protein 22-like [Quillaja saponaria]|uniref:Coiled-coil domain-containing protein 22-like n=1 Tax=Quillaja saponaria TaxID=32244 RepID=A0AAD7LSL9_QUISA|nr:coiled-coil domain-containing protein 22-like [Quillaja saponaria]
MDVVAVDDASSFRVAGFCNDELTSVLSGKTLPTREDEHSQLTAKLEKKPKQASRKSYIQRVKEITKNSRKQDADIERILEETRELQLKSNSIQERLH